MFSVCFDATGTTIASVWTGRIWKRIIYQNPQMMTNVQWSKVRRIQDSGFATDWQELFTGIRDDQWVDGLSDHMVRCPKLSGVRPSNAKAGVMHIRVEEPTFPMVTEQGALPQVLALLAQIGGSISLLTTIFFLVWVRRFPDSEVTNTYEARTLAGFSAAADSSRAAQEEHRQRNDSTSAAHRAPDSTASTFGLTQEYPRFPPGIALPAGCKHTE